MDLSKLAPERRSAYIRSGKQFGSTDTLQQAALTLQAFERYGKQVADFGFVQKDADTLALARGALQSFSGGREERRAGRKHTSAAFAAALQKGKRARMQARAVLESVESELLDTGHDAAAVLSSVLDHTRTAGSDAQKLTEQLAQLDKALAGKDVAAAAKARGGPAAATALKAALAGLAALDGTVPSGHDTSDVTEQMDLLDGYIVELVRRARRSARAAARALGQPDLAKAFELSALYNDRPPSGGEPGPT